MGQNRSHTAYSLLPKMPLYILRLKAPPSRLSLGRKAPVFLPDYPRTPPSQQGLVSPLLQQQLNALDRPF
jgi:hypothetical protein